MAVIFRNAEVGSCMSLLHLFWVTGCQVKIVEEPEVEETWIY